MFSIGAYFGRSPQVLKVFSKEVAKVFSYSMFSIGANFGRCPQVSKLFVGSGDRSVFLLEYA
jgi:hypothetical protein